MSHAAVKEGAIAAAAARMARTSSARASPSLGSTRISFNRDPEEIAAASRIVPEIVTGDFRRGARRSVGGPSTKPPYCAGQNGQQVCERPFRHLVLKRLQRRVAVSVQAARPPGLPGNFVGRFVGLAVGWKGTLDANGVPLIGTSAQGGTWEREGASSATRPTAPERGFQRGLGLNACHILARADREAITAWEWSTSSENRPVSFPPIGSVVLRRPR